MLGLFLLQMVSLQPRFAFLLLAGLTVGAAVPLAIGWARLLPEEKPPFEIENPRRRTAAPAASIYGSEPAARKFDLAAFILLFLLTVSFAVQFPGVLRQVGLNTLPDHIPVLDQWFEVALPCLLIAVAAAAVFHGAIRKSFLQSPLLAGGSLVLLLWLLAPWLYWALAAS